MKKLKVLFLTIEDQEKSCMNVYEVAAVSYLTAFLREKGYTVKLKGGDIKDLKYTEIEDFDPDIIGLRHNVLKELIDSTITRLKERNPNLYVCVGIGHPSPYYKEMLENNPLIDLAVCGEAELPWLDLLNCIEEGKSIESIKGLILRKGNEVIETGNQDLIDLDNLPNTAMDLYKNEACIMTSRGCTGNCSFCNLRSMQRGWRGKNATRIADEIEYIYKYYDMRMFKFADFSFEDPDIHCNRLKNIAHEIISRDLNIVYDANFRPNFFGKINSDTVELLLKSGLSSAFVGIESNNEGDLKLYNKHSTLQDNRGIVSFFNTMDIHVEIGFINFNPYSTIDGLRKNADFLERFGFANFDTIKWYTGIIKGTNLYNKFTKEEQGVDYFKNDEVKKLFRYVDFYIKDILEKEGGLARKYQKEIKDLRYMHNFGILQKRNGFNDASCYVQENYRQIKLVRDSMSMYIANWFKRLLDIAESGFDEKRAVDVSFGILSPDFVKETTGIMAAKRLKFEETIKTKS